MNLMVSPQKPAAILLCAKLQAAAGQGIEPQFTPPKGAVLPLDEPAISNTLSFAREEFEDGEF